MSTTIKQKENIDVLARQGTCIEFFSAYQDMDIDRMLSLCSESGTVSFVPLGADYSGKINGIGKGLWAALMEAFPNLDNTVKEQHYDAQANEVTCRVVIFGTQEKEFAGMPSKGHEFDSEHIFIFRFEQNGKISNINISWDHESFVNQLTK